MKKLLILGAGRYQVPLIKMAKEMGLYTITCSIDGDYPGFKLADKVYYENITDAEAVLKVAQTEHIDAIATTGSDVGIPTLGKVCDAMGLPGVSYDAAKAASNKILMKQKFLQGGVRTAKFEVVSDYDQALKAAQDMEFPIMIKAADLSGSRGISKVHSFDKDAVKAAVEKVRDFSGKEEFIVEECIEGIEFGAQSLVCGGKIKFVLPHGDYVFEGDTGVPVGHYVPYAVDAAILEESIRQTELCVKALGIDNCAINMDYILKGDQVYALEVGARAGATCLPEMVSIYYGIDYYEVIIRLALGEEIDDINTAKGIPNVCKLLTSDRTGYIKSISFPEDLSDNVLELSCDFGEGHKVNKFRIGPDRIGQIIVKGDTLEGAVAEMEDTLAKVKIEVE